jgi:hypothetical protein
MAVSFAGIDDVSWRSDPEVNKIGTCYQLYINGVLRWYGIQPGPVDVTADAAAGPIVAHVVTTDPKMGSVDQYTSFMKATAHAIDPMNSYKLGGYWPGPRRTVPASPAQAPSAVGPDPSNPRGLNVQATPNVSAPVQSWGFVPGQQVPEGYAIGGMGDYYPYVGPNPADPSAPVAFATDEDVAIEVPSDIWALTSSDMCDAYGEDGSILAAAPWDLMSPGVDFAQRGLGSSQIVWLRSPETIFGGDPGMIFAVAGVDAVDPHVLHLRRLGRPPGLGDPPGDGIQDLTPANGMAVAFECRTLAAEILRASAEIDEQFKISQILADRPNRILDPKDYMLLRNITVYAVLERRFMATMSIQQMPGAKDTHQEKSKAYAQLRKDVGTTIAFRFTTGEPARRAQKWSRII